MTEFYSNQFVPTITTGVTNVPYTITTDSTFISNIGQFAQPVMAYAPPEDELGWLRRRVSEITELVAA